MTKEKSIRAVIDAVLLEVIDLLTRYFGGKSQFLPSLEELGSEEIKTLSKRLKGKSEKETLNNLLEWQTKNIHYWVERGYLDSSLHLLIVFGLVFIFIFISAPIMVFFYLILARILSFSQIYH